MKRQITPDEARSTEDFLGQTIPRIMRDEQLDEAQAYVNGILYLAMRCADGTIEMSEEGGGAPWRATFAERVTG